MIEHVKASWQTATPRVWLWLPSELKDGTGNMSVAITSIGDEFYIHTTPKFALKRVLGTRIKKRGTKVCHDSKCLTIEHRWSGMYMCTVCTICAVSILTVYRPGNAIIMLKGRWSFRSAILNRDTENSETAPSRMRLQIIENMYRNGLCEKALTRYDIRTQRLETKLPRL